jgi:hypothetical protein
MKPDHFETRVAFAPLATASLPLGRALSEPDRKKEAGKVEPRPSLRAKRSNPVQ